jgi:hypothetical protein
VTASVRVRRDRSAGLRETRPHGVSSSGVRHRTTEAVQRSNAVPGGLSEKDRPGTREMGSPSELVVTRYLAGRPGGGPTAAIPRALERLGFDAEIEGAADSPALLPMPVGVLPTARADLQPRPGDDRRYCRGRRRTAARGLKRAPPRPTHLHDPPRREATTPRRARQSPQASPYPSRSRLTTPAPGTPWTSPLFAQHFLTGPEVSPNAAEKLVDGRELNLASREFPHDQSRCRIHGPAPHGKRCC